MLPRGAARERIDVLDVHRDVLAEQLGETLGDAAGEAGAVARLADDEPDAEVAARLLDDLVLPDRVALEEDAEDGEGADQLARGQLEAVVAAPLGIGEERQRAAARSPRR
jgi:hypothetical protein